MSISYLVTHESDGDNGINLAELEADLRNKWEDISVIRRPESSTSAMYWVIDFGEAILEGRVNRSQNYLDLEGYLDDVAAFVVWYRSVMPLGQKLKMIDSGYNYGELELTERTSEEDIMMKFSSDPSQ